MEFEFHCYYQADRRDRGPAYQFWLNALGPNLHVNGRKVEMTNSLVNIMHSAVSLIQTSSRQSGFYLFIQLHEVYWPEVDRNITWDQHFFLMAIDKIPWSRLSTPRHATFQLWICSDINSCSSSSRELQAGRKNQSMDGRNRISPLEIRRGTLSPA